MRIKAFFLISVLALAFPAFAETEPSWPDLREALYGDQLLTLAGEHISIDAPYRSSDDARTQIAADVTAPNGTMLDSVTLILDENPMPVSAVFKFEEPLPRFFFDLSMRINGPTPVHVVAKTTGGQLLVGETFVKTSGQGACSAPPGTDPEAMLATLGQMQISITEMNEVKSPSERLAGLLSAPQKKVDLEISHPSLSGMQMDQISLLFIPMRYVENVQIDLDGRGFVDVTGSISLSENPRISLSVPGQTRSVDVTMTDTDGTVTTARKSLAGF
ncbi:MAG: quinoprotein dehydrogenase-associated SoxYZ-like carrier [Paracoccaceae bacterium]